MTKYKDFLDIKKEANQVQIGVIINFKGKPYYSLMDNVSYAFSEFKTYPESNILYEKMPEDQIRVIKFVHDGGYVNIEDQGFVTFEGIKVGLLYKNQDPNFWKCVESTLETVFKEEKESSFII